MERIIITLLSAMLATQVVYFWIEPAAAVPFVLLVVGGGSGALVAGKLAWREQTVRLKEAIEVAIASVDTGRRHYVRTILKRRKWRRLGFTVVASASGALMGMAGIVFIGALLSRS